MSTIDITDANAKLTMTVETIYMTGFKIEHFSSDTAWAAEDAVLAEARMGVDGHLAAGYTPTPRLVNIQLEANSPTYEKFKNIAETMQLSQAVLECNLTVSIPSIGKEYRLTKGVLTQGKPLPNGERILGPTNWQFTFEKLTSGSN